jgi:hypothetical protein
MLVQHYETGKHRATSQFAEVCAFGDRNVRGRPELHNPAVTDDERLIIFRRRTNPNDHSDVAEHKWPFGLTVGAVNRIGQKNGDRENRKDGWPFRHLIPLYLADAARQRQA